MPIFTFKRLFAFCLAFFLVQGSAMAAEDSAETTVSIVVPQLVRISQMDDMPLGYWSGKDDLDAQQQVCVWSSSRIYSLTALSTNPVAGDFTLLGPDELHIAYSVQWTDAESSQHSLAHGQLVSGLATAARSSDCSDADGQARPATLAVHVDRKALQKGVVGRYADTLLVVVAAE